MEYNVEPDKKTPLIIVILLFILGVMLAFTPSLFKDLPSWIFQFPAVILLLVCILLLSRFVLTTYTYQLYDAGNIMSPFPKLNIYRIKKAGSKMVYCIPFNNVFSIEKVDKIGKPDMPRENLCASMFPKEIYQIIYQSEKKEAIFIECDRRFASEIARRIEEYSEVAETDA